MCTFELRASQTLSGAVSKLFWFIWRLVNAAHASSPVVVCFVDMQLRPFRSRLIQIAYNSTSLLVVSRVDLLTYLRNTIFSCPNNLRLWAKSFLNFDLNGNCWTNWYNLWISVGKFLIDQSQLLVNKIINKLKLNKNFFFNLTKILLNLK